jgi:excisionase family DNA binding protein
MPYKHIPSRVFSLDQRVVLLSVREAAKVLGVTERSVYGYVAKRKLSAMRIEGCVMLREAEVLAFERQAPGRPRILVAVWHIPPQRNRQYMTTITVRVRAGAREGFESRLVEIQQSATHGFFGTSARYVVRNEDDPDEIDLVLVWRGAVMPSLECREAALAALAADLAEVLEWEKAVVKKGEVLLHAG